MSQPENRAWEAEAEGNKLILLFEGYMYGDTAVSEGMVVAAIHRFRTKQEIELNPEYFPEDRATGGGRWRG